MKIEDISPVCRIEQTKEDIQKYSTDASVFEVSPQAVAFPKNVGELSLLIKKAGELGITLSPRGAGTCMSGGSLTEGVMVDMTAGFTTIGEIDVEKKQVWVDSGVFYRDLEKATLAKGLLFPPYTSSKDFCAVGGMVGNNASGEKSLRYGATINNVLAIKMVCSDGNEYEFGEITWAEYEDKAKLETLEGEIYRKLGTLIHEEWEAISSARPKVKKNAAGYGLWHVWDAEKKVFNIAKLIVGSQGTLGFVTSALLNLVPAPQYTRMILLPVQSLPKLALAVQTILAHKPEGLETYDYHTYNLAKDYMTAIAQDAQRAEGMHLVLFAQFAEESQEVTDAKADECIADLQAKGFEAVLVTDKKEQDAHWAIRRASFKLLKDYSHGSSRAVPVIEDTIVPIEKYGDFLEKLEKILADYNMVYTYAGHIGDGSIRLIPLANMEDPKTADMILDCARRTYELTVSFGGSISVDHNDGIIRTPFLHLMFSNKVLDIFKQTKEIFDPKYMFNPGKKIGGTLQYAHDHMSRKNVGIF